MQKQIRIVEECMRVGDEVVTIDPLQTHLPEKIKKIWLETMTGQKWVTVKK